jgi:hypothetical protein
MIAGMSSVGLLVVGAVLIILGLALGVGWLYLIGVVLAVIGAVLVLVDLVNARR